MKISVGYNRVWMLISYRRINE